MIILVCQPVTENMRRRFGEIFPGHEFIYNEKPDREDFEKAGVIFGFPEPEMIKYAEKLRFVQLCSSGAEKHVDVVPRDVPLCSTTGIFGGEIAEVMLGYLLSINKYLPVYRDRQRQHSWDPGFFNRPVRGSTVLILGLGDIGMNFARLVKALDCHVIGLRRTMGEKPDCADELYTTDKLDELIPRADVIAMCMPSTRQTQNLMTRERIFAMKKGSVLINVGRGSALDTMALCDALNEGHLFGAAIDVVDTEPLPAGHPAWDVPNLIITPHVSGRSYSPWLIEQCADVFIRNFAAFLSGGELEALVDRDTGYMVSRK